MVTAIMFLICSTLLFGRIGKFSPLIKLMMLNLAEQCFLYYPPHDVYEFWISVTLENQLSTRIVINNLIAIVSDSKYLTHLPINKGHSIFSFHHSFHITLWRLKRKTYKRYGESNKDNFDFLIRICKSVTASAFLHKNHFFL